MPDMFMSPFCCRKTFVSGASERPQGICSSLRQNCQKLKFLHSCDRYEQKSRKELSRRIIQSARAHPFGTTVSLLRSQNRPLERYGILSTLQESVEYTQWVEQLVLFLSRKLKGFLLFCKNYYY